VAEVLQAVGKGFKFIGVVLVAFGEAITVSFYGNIKKRYAKAPREHYYSVKVPEGYKSEANQPEYKDMSTNNEFSDFTGFPKI